MSESTTIRWEQDADGIVTLVLDDPAQSANTMNAAFADSLDATLDRLEAEIDGVRGVIVTSAKKTFFAGGDLRDLIRATPENAEQVFAGSMRIKRRLRRLETLGKPVVAAINGAALGGGYEIALACHHRVALDTPGTKIGCPEVTLGLLPGGGGVVRTVRLLGIADALLKVLLQGRQYVRAARPGGRPGPRGGHRPRRPAGARPRLHRRQPRRPAALGRARLQDPRRHPQEPGLRRQPARLPGEPAQAARRRPLPGAARHPGGGRRGLPGRHRHRLRHRGPLLHRAGLRPHLEEHDPGVLLRHAGRQLRRQPPQGRARPPGRQGGRPRRRHDGRRHRLLLRPGRHRGGAQGRHPGGRRPRQGVLREAARQGARPRAAPHPRSATRCSPGSPRPPTRPTSRAATPSSRRSSRTRP